MNLVFVEVLAKCNVRYVGCILASLVMVGVCLCKLAHLLLEGFGLCKYIVCTIVLVDVGGYGIIWNDELDLSCDELWDNGTTVETPFDGLIAFSDATELWGLNESTLRKAISYGKLVNGVDVCKFGKQWVVSIDAMKREYGNVTNW